MTSDYISYSYYIVIAQLKFIPIIYLLEIIENTRVSLIDLTVITRTLHLDYVSKSNAKTLH